MQRRTRIRNLSANLFCFRKAGRWWALIISLIVCMTGTSAFATTYYVAFSGGSDSNNGTSTATPWKHVTGMTGCTNTCKSTAIVGGDTIIFKGGETWIASYPWTFQSGTSSMVTYTVDQAWYTGGAWSQPVFDDQGAGPGDTGMANLTNKGWLTLNNLKFKGCGILGTLPNSDKCLVFANPHDLAITNCTFRTYAWISIYLPMTVSGSYSNLTFTGNDVANTSSMLWIGGTVANTNIHNVIITHNVVHDISSQLGNPSSPGGGVHANAFLHYYSSGAHNDPTQYMDGVVFCNNRAYGDFRNEVDESGVANTAMFFTEGSVSAVICNNVLVFSPVEAQMFNALIYLAGYSNPHVSTVEIYNNTLIQEGVNAMSSGIHIQSWQGIVTLRNNLVSGMKYAFEFDLPKFVSLDTDCNLLRSTNAELKYGTVFQSYATWQAAGRDTHSVLGSNPLVVSYPSDLHLQKGSPAIGAGTDLTSLGITLLNSDYDGVTRGASWDIGAYQQRGGVGAPGAPTGLRVVAASDSTATILWAPSTEADFAGHRVYRAPVPGQMTILAATVTPASAAASHSP